jgi:hypothetical protein
MSTHETHQNSSDISFQDMAGNACQYSKDALEALMRTYKNWSDETISYWFKKLEVAGKNFFTLGDVKIEIELVPNKIG